ncbi:hypothetical protein N7454_009930 [Penicillium verhagenii]|nr:hypothetical protein N7454_009930 [Penicillium verhagenii]
MDTQRTPGPLEPTTAYEFKKLAIAKWEVCMDMVMQIIQLLVTPTPSKVQIRFLVESFHAKLSEVNRMIQNNDPNAMDSFQFFRERINKCYSTYAAWGTSRAKAAEVEHDLRALRRLMLEVSRTEDFPFRG